MSKRFEVGDTCGVFDLKSNDHEYCLNDIEVCDLLNNQAKQIADLEEQLKNARKEVFTDLKEKYKQKMANALGDDEEIGHINCDAVLEELLEEIGFDEVLELYRSQIKWFA